MITTEYEVHGWKYILNRNGDWSGDVLIHKVPIEMWRTASPVGKPETISLPGDLFAQILGTKLQAELIALLEDWEP